MYEEIINYIKEVEIKCRYIMREFYYFRKERT